MANHILIPESRADAILTEVGVVPGQTTDGMTGTYNMDVMLKNGPETLSSDLDQILENHGYQAESSAQRDYIHTGVNWGYTGAQLSGSMDPATCHRHLRGAAAHHLHRLPHHLQCVPDLRHQRHPVLWPAEDHRHHPRQLRRIIRHQALALSLAGIPLGLVLGWLIGGQLTPVIVRQLNGVVPRVSVDPMILRPRPCFPW